MKDTIAVCLLDIIVIGCFTFLAYYFNHWWIILFSMLFLFEKKGSDKE